MSSSATQQFPNFELKDHKYTGLTPVGRLVNVNLETPRPAQEGSPPKFSIGILWDAADIAEMWQVVCKIADTELPSNEIIDRATNQRIVVPGSALFAQGLLHNPLRDGNEKYAADPTKNAIYANKWFMNTGKGPNSKTGVLIPVTTFDVTGLETPPGNLYRGCYARAHVTFAFFTAKQKKGVTAYLLGVQFARDGERLGNAAGSYSAGAFAKAPLPQPPDAPTGGFNGAPGPAPGYAAPAGMPSAPPPATGGFQGYAPPQQVVAGPGSGIQYPGHAAAAPQSAPHPAANGFAGYPAPPPTQQFSAPPLPPR